MSDLISTPSQTQSVVSNENFEALIDLLASDGIDEDPATLAGNPQPNMTLRDSSGKLDFDKIRQMFAVQNESHRLPTAPEPPKEKKTRVQSPPMPNEDSDSDNEAGSHRSASSMVPSRSNSVSPKPVKQATSGHRRSSTFGSQPLSAIHENATPAKVDVASTLLHQPLSFDEVNTALACAQEEVRSLRRQYDELQALVSKRLGTETQNPHKLSVNTAQVVSDKDNGCVETRDVVFQAQSSAVVPPGSSPSNVPTEIANLSEDEAKRALSTLVRSLNLSLSAIDPLASLPTPVAPTSPQQGLSSLSLTRQHDVASIVRALKFIGTVDELVWRRSSPPSGPRTLLPVFSEENTVALLARLELWERAVRRSSRA